MVTVLKTGELRCFKPHINIFGGVVGTELRFTFYVSSTILVYTETTGFLESYGQLLSRHVVPQQRGQLMVDTWKTSRAARLRSGKSRISTEVKMYCWLITLVDVYNPPVLIKRIWGQTSVIVLEKD